MGISVCFRFRKNVFQLHLSLICGLPNDVKKQIQIEKFWLKFSWFYTGVGQARCEGCVGRITSTSISVGFRTGCRGRSRTSWTATTRASRTTCSRPTRPRTATATTSPLSGKNNGGTSKRFRIALSKEKRIVLFVWLLIDDLGFGWISCDVCLGFHVRHRVTYYLSSWMGCMATSVGVYTWRQKNTVVKSEQ